MKLIEAFQEIANNKEVHFSTKLRGSELTVNYFDVDDFGTVSGSMLSVGDIIRCLNQEIHHVKIKSKDKITVKDKKIEPTPITKKDLEAIGYAFGEMKKALQNGWDKSIKNESFKENKKIEKIDYNINTNFRNIVDKINEIIDKLNAGVDK